MRRPGSLFATLYLALFAAAAHAHELPSGNLAALGRIWGIVRYAHPALAYKDIDWDAAAVRAIQRVRMAPRSPSTLTAAVDEMLAALGDDATRVTPSCTEAVAATAANRSTRLLADGIVYVSATSPADAQTTDALRNARTAVVDLRPQPGHCSAPALGSELVPLLVRGTVPHAKHRKVRHHGYRSQSGDVVESPYRSSFAIVDTGFEVGPETAVTSVVFIVDERSDVPPFATALAAEGKAMFVSAGTFPLHTALDYCQIGLLDGSIVTIRTSELVDEDGFTAEPAPMMTLAADTPDDEVLAAALQIARPRPGRRRATGLRSLRVPEFRFRADATYPDMEVPPVEHRILAAYRLWNVIDLFYGNRDALGEWDAHFSAIIALLENADTRREYELALAEVMALVPDGQSYVQSNALLALQGVAAPPFRLMEVEEKAVVVETSVESVKRGDQLLGIDGRDVAARIAELQRYAAGDVMRDVPNGATGSAAAFTFRRADGSQYAITLARGTQTPSELPKAWRILDGNIAYVDLHQLDVDEVPALFTEIAFARALIVDLRNGTAQSVAAAMASRLTDSPLTSVVRVPDIVGGTYWFTELRSVIAPSELPTYSGRTIALVDSRTQSEAELAAVTLQRTGMELVGSTTAGALGTPSHFVTPGNIRVRFTAMDVRDAAGRSVLGLGLEPDHVAQPTIRGLAEGRDEVLERAVALADQ